MLGTVKWFDEKKGYGFIIGEDEKDYFFHFSSIITEEGFKTAGDGQKVTFDKDPAEKDRPRAKNVRKIG